GQTAPSGDGLVYFNDIKLYPPRCVPEKAIADITGDCVVGTEDLDLMAKDWLEYDHDVYPTEPAPTGLVAWYEFEDSNNIGWDSSGNELHGDPCGDATIVYDAGGNGKLPGNVLNLESAGAYINCGSDPMFDITESITLACWLKVNSFESWWVQILSRGQDSYRLASKDGFDWLEFVIEGVVPDWHIYGSIDVADGQWHHVIGVYEHNVAAYLYIDGVVDVSQAMSGDIILSEADVCIGSNVHSPTNLNGWMDDVRIYDRALSQAEILYLASEGANNDPYYNPVTSPANIYDEEPQYQKAVNFMDYAIMADNWLDEILWP
ncbi:MAG: LamG domain-containing protein, partial [Planctomycetota bacterium]